MLGNQEREHEEEKDEYSNPKYVLADDNELFHLKPDTLNSTHRFVPFLNRYGMLKLYSGVRGLEMGTAFDDSVTQEEIDRFMKYVSIDPGTGAWIWTGGTGNTGYGGFWFRGKTIGAHVFSFRIKYGPIPSRMLVCHKFEDLGRNNVNPDHLFLGTHADNMQDASRKDRTLRGDRNRASKLSDEDVRAIAASEETYRSLSERYGVSEAMISQIKRGRRWAHITGLTPTTRHHLRNKSGYIGVRWRERGKKWNAAIGKKVDGAYKSQHLGGYETAEEAARAYDAAARSLHGAGARLNFPEE